MCGIAGWADFSNDRLAPALLTNMVRTLRHRGPDADGELLEGAVALGHTRLSILDLTDGGAQPMQSPCGRYVLTYNGEVYNFKELRQELQRKGYQFSSESDTEVVLAAFQCWGVECFQRFNGMFALGLWDRTRQELVLARDRFGIKPLYYFHDSGRLIFASEIKALIVTGLVPKKISSHGLHEFLYYGNALGNRTLFSGVLKLAPGSILRYDANGDVKQSRFWSPTSVKPTQETLPEIKQTIGRLLRESVKRHLVSDVPVGAFLSGGLDSGCITALASQQLGTPLATFSVAFDNDDPKAGELPLARLVADRYGTDHHEVSVRGAAVQDTLISLISCHDEPFSDAANIPLYLLCQKLGGNPKVILQGDGGDELFGGYRRYPLLAAGGPLRRVSRLLSGLQTWPPRTERAHRLGRMLTALGHRSDASRMALLLTMETKQATPLRILHPDYRYGVGRHDPFADYVHWNAALNHLDPVQRMLYTDTLVQLPNQFLEKVDKSTMAHGIEVRVPMLDSELADYVMSIPSRTKVRLRRSKWLLRDFLRTELPREIIHAKKRGFGVPYGHWLRGPLATLMGDAFSNRSIVELGLFDRQILQQVQREHLTGNQNHGFFLYKLLNLCLWIEQFQISGLGGEPSTDLVGAA